MIGIDIVSIERIRKFIDRFQHNGLKKFLYEDEIKIAKYPQTIAGFWATKEAISKALGCGIGKELSFFGIKITKTQKGAPYVEFSKKAKKLHKIKECKISITHDNGIAIAVALIKKKKKDKNGKSI